MFHCWFPVHKGALRIMYSGRVYIDTGRGWRRYGHVVNGKIVQD